MRSPKRRLTYFFVALQVALAFLMVAPSWAVERGMPFTIEPSPGATVHSGYFVFDATAGSSVSASVTVRNTSTRPITLHIQPVAALTAAMGGVDYRNPEEDLGVGSWIDLKTTKVRLGPGSSREVSFSVSIPDDANDGTNLAGIAAWVPVRSTSAPDAGGGANALVSVQTRRVIAVQVNLPSTDRPQIDVESIRTVALPDGPYLELTFKNSGPILTHGSGTVSVEGLAFQRDFAFDTFVPGTTMRYPLELEEMPASGSYDANVQLDFGGEETSWSGQFEIGSELTDELVDRGAIDVPKTFPIWMLAVGAFPFLLAVLLVWRRRRTPSKLAI